VLAGVTGAWDGKAGVPRGRWEPCDRGRGRTRCLALAAAGQRDDLQPVAVLQSRFGVLPAGDQFLVELDGDGFPLEPELLEELPDGQAVWVLLRLVIYDNMHGGTRASGWWGDWLRKAAQARIYFAMIDRLLLGTGNRKKRLEMEDLLQGQGVRLLTLADFPGIPDVEEDGSSFAENAAKKATGYALASGCWTVCDDSGISVEALGGAPGIYSARFAGPGADDEANNRLLLERLSGVPDERRGAYYTCHIALADPQGEIRLRSEAICRGRLRHTASGRGGFGYDPLFEVLEYHTTFGDLGPAAKRAISHRARALRDFVCQWKRLVRSLDSGEVAVPTTPVSRP